MVYDRYMSGIWAIELVKFDQPNCMEMLPKHGDVTQPIHQDVNKDGDVTSMRIPTNKGV